CRGRAGAGYGRRLHRGGRAGSRSPLKRGKPGMTPTSRNPAFIRVAALVRKEAYQLVRDPSSIAIGVIMPVLLILLFGYALSLDVKAVPVAVVLEDTSPAASELASGFRLSPYFAAE